MFDNLRVTDLFNNPVQFEGEWAQLTDVSADRKTLYLNTYNSKFDLSARIKCLVIFIFKSIASFGFFPFQTDGKSLFRQFFCGREIVLRAKYPLNIDFTSLGFSISKIRFDAFVNNTNNSALSDFNHINLLGDLYGYTLNLSAYNVYHPSRHLNLSVIGKLPHLEELYLGGNMLTELPENFENLVKLTKLDLFINHLATLPNCIPKLNNLKELNICANKLTSLPESIGGLRELVKLEVHLNHLTSLPEGLANLTKLRHLSICSNSFTSIPPVLYRLNSNCTVYLLSNPLTEEAMWEVLRTTGASNYQGPRIHFSAVDDNPSHIQLVVRVRAEYAAEVDAAVQAVLAAQQAAFAAQQAAWAAQQTAIQNSLREAILHNGYTMAPEWKKIG